VGAASALARGGGVRGAALVFVMGYANHTCGMTLKCFQENGTTSVGAGSPVQVQVRHMPGFFTFFTGPRTVWDPKLLGKLIKNMIALAIVAFAVAQQPSIRTESGYGH